MTPHRRLGSKDSHVRARLVEAAINIAMRDGCAALTAGRLADEVGLSRQSVHYYFGTIEDIFVEIIRFQHEEMIERAKAALRTGNPIRQIWEFRREISSFASEILAMAGRSDIIRQELKRSIDELTDLSASATIAYAETNDITLPMPAEALVVILTSLSYTLALGREFQITNGHEQTVAVIEDWLQSIEKSAG